MNLKLDEAVVSAVVAKLQANIATRIAQINTEYTDLAISPIIDYYVSGVESIPKAPAIIVVPGQSLFSEEGPHSLGQQIDILVYILEQDQNRENLGRRLLRQSRAVIESIWDSDPLEKLDGSPVPVAHLITPQRTFPGSVFEPTDDDSWRGFYLVVFRAERFET